MMTPLPTLYQLKKALLLPRTQLLRHREKLEPGFLRSAMELHYYRPAFYRWLGAIADNPHLLYEHPLTDESIVLDVGAYTGQWSTEVLSRYQPNIYAFEPDPRNFKKLEQTALNHCTLTPMEFGLGDKDEVVAMTLQFMGSSITPGQSEAKKRHKKANVMIKDVALLWQSLQLKSVDLMKINIEGGEFSLLERMTDVNLHTQVDCFLIQFHEWHPNAYQRRARIRKTLAKTHNLQWDYHFIWEKWVRR